MDKESYQNVYKKFISNINVLINKNINTREIGEYIDNILEEKINNFIHNDPKNLESEKEIFTENNYGCIKTI